MTREPLAVRAAITAGCAAVLHALVVLGVISIAPEAEQAVVAAIDAVGLIVAIAWGRAAVTPVADPRLPAHRAD